MKFVDKIILVPAFALTFAGMSAVGASNTFAQGSVNQSTIVQRIAEKFGLKAEEVQAVFDEEHKTREAEMTARYEQKLTDAVTNGDLTEEKKQLILAKNKELQAYRESIKDTFSSMSVADKKAAMEKTRTELTKWATDNEIDLKYLHVKIAMKHGGPGFRGEMKFKSE